MRWPFTGGAGGGGIDVVEFELVDGLLTEVAVLDKSCFDVFVAPYIDTGLCFVVAVPARARAVEVDSAFPPFPAILDLRDMVLPRSVFSDALSTVAALDRTEPFLDGSGSGVPLAASLDVEGFSESSFPRLLLAAEGFSSSALGCFPETEPVLRFSSGLAVRRGLGGGGGILAVSFFSSFLVRGGLRSPRLLGRDDGEELVRTREA